MNEGPKRSRFRFSLRMLFVGVTLVGCLAGWVTYQLKWIADRRAARLNLGEITSSALPPIERPAPWSLRIFCERGLDSTMYIKPSVSDREVERIQSLFPEVKLTRLRD